MIKKIIQKKTGKEKRKNREHLDKFKTNKKRVNLNPIILLIIWNTNDKHSY